MSLILSGDSGVTFPNSTTQASAGSVIQVVQGSLNTVASSSSSSLTASGLSASITPKFSTSKILITVNMVATGKNQSNANNCVTLAYYKNGSLLSYITDEHGFTSSAAANFLTASHQYLDSPATTSSTTYAIYFGSTISAGVVYFNSYYNTQANNISTITLMEIAQ